MYSFTKRHRRSEEDRRVIVGFTSINAYVSSNPVNGEVYLIQHCVINFVSDLRHVGGFLLVLRLPPPIKLTATIELKYY